MHYPVRYSRITHLFKSGFLSFLIISCINVVAQDTTVARIRNTYVDKFDSSITLKLALNNAAEAFFVDTDYDDYLLEPNAASILRAYVNYRFISFFVSHIPHFLPGNNDDSVKGKTTGTALGFTVNMHDWFAELGYSRTTGYYLANTKDFRPQWQPGDPYLQVPDLRITSFDGIIGYNTNPNLSLAAVSSQTERQLRSAGAFIPRFSFRYYTVNDRSPGTTQKSNNLLIGIGAGYHHTFVVAKKLYFMASFAPSFGYVYTRLLTRDPAGDIITNTRSPVYMWDSRAGIGYNTDRFFTGIYMTALSNRHTQGFTTAVNSNGQVFLQLFAGIRLPAPKAIAKTYRKLFGN